MPDMWKCPRTSVILLAESNKQGKKKILNMRTAAHMPVVEEPQIGKVYHLAWANIGCVWELKAIDGQNCTMRARATGKELPAKVSELRHTRRNAEAIGLEINS